MSQEKTTQSSNLKPDESQPIVAATVTSPQRRKLLRARAAWWFKLFVQPLLMLAAIVALGFGFGFAQRMGLFSPSELSGSEEESSGEEVLYICPMVCVPPTTEPGKCPTCGMDLKARKSSGDSKDKYGLTLDSASIRVANIRTTIAEAKPLVRKMRTIGQISYDEGSLATISAYVDGRIVKLYADYTGVEVGDGDELALLYSPDLYSSQVAFLESIKLLNGSRSTSRRIDNSNRRLYESSRQRLIELGLTENQVDQLEKTGKADSRIRIVSPIAGTVIEKMVENGQYVKTGQAIYKVADLSTVWLMLELFPKDAANICFGQKVTTKIQSHPGKEFVGRVAFIDPSVDTKTQTVRVRVVLPNASGLIRVGDFATASIVISANSPADQEGAVYDADLVGKWISPRHPHVIADGPGKCTECGMELVPASKFGFVSAPITQQHHVVVPRNSVLMAGGHSVVFVETEPGRFEFREVEVGEIVGDSVSLVSGVKQGESVAMSSVFLLDSAFSMMAKPSLIDPTRAIPRLPEVIDEFNTPEVIAALAELSETDRQAVKLQKMCPVADGVLGSMGVPIPVDVDGRRIWICCGGCETPLRNDSGKYFAILDNAAAEALEKQNKIDEAMAELSAEDRKLAIAQDFCPVANMPLGSMGAPIKVDVKGRAVFICCEGCRDDLLKNSDMYFEILANGPQEAEESPVELPTIRPFIESEDVSDMAVPSMTPPLNSGADQAASGKEKMIDEALATLSVADQELARKQKICPVADLPLGSMGTPIKVDVDGQPVFICCEGCRGRLLKEPAKYLVKLPTEAAK